jgi:hypothetical protein
LFLQAGTAAVLWAASLLLLATSCARAGGAYAGPGCRKHVARVTEYGAVGDGRTLNTAAFARAVADLARRARDGGAALVVPPGKWLTGPFNLTSCFTLYLDEGAEILASQVSENPTPDPPPAIPLAAPAGLPLPWLRRRA